MTINETTPATARKRAPRKLAAVKEVSPAPAAPATAPEAAPATPAPATPEAAPAPVKLSGYRAHAVNPAPSAMVYFTAWILENNAEFAPLAGIDRGLLERFVTVASKDYRHYQKL